MGTKTTLYFDPDISDIERICIKYHGNISAMANYYNVNRDTIYEYMNRRPEGKVIIDKVRRMNNENFLDMAEHVIRYNLTNYQNDSSLAQRAAEKVIDKKGRLRGWHDSVVITDQMQESETDIQNQNMLLKAQLAKYMEKHGPLDEVHNQSQTGQELPGSDAQV